MRLASHAPVWMENPADRLQAAPTQAIVHAMNPATPFRCAVLNALPRLLAERLLRLAR